MAFPSMATRRSIASAMIGLSLIACSDSKPAGEAPIDFGDGASEGAEVNVLMSALSGGSLELSTRAMVTVPAGALSEDVEIGLRRPPDAEARQLIASVPEHQLVASAPYVLTPHGLTFKQPVEVSLPVGQSAQLNSLLVAWLEDEEDTSWEMLGKPSIKDGLATMTVSHFSVLVLVEDRGAAGGETDAGDEPMVPGPSMGTQDAGRPIMPPAQTPKDAGTPSATDAGAARSDAGVQATDAGAASSDAGSSEIDAGMSSATDAGAAADAGASLDAGTVSDASAPMTDAGGRDAGSVDAGAPDAGAGVCGDGNLDPNETCDVQIPVGTPGACVSQDCSYLDEPECVVGVWTNEPDPCNPYCQAVTTCEICGDGEVVGWENCDTGIAAGLPGACPDTADCDAMDDSCFDYSLVDQGPCYQYCEVTAAFCF